MGLKRTLYPGDRAQFNTSEGAGVLKLLRVRPDNGSAPSTFDAKWTDDNGTKYFRRVVTGVTLELEVDGFEVLVRTLPMETSKALRVRFDVSASVKIHLLGGED